MLISKRAWLLAVFFAPLLQAQESPVRSDNNPFDLSASAALVEKGVPRVSSVDAMRVRAYELVDEGNCAAAIDALDAYARSANALANLIAAGLEPFYGASYDDRRNFPHARTSTLAPYEQMANQYKRDRNRAMVLRAECLVSLGDTEGAVVLLHRALGILEPEDWEWWERARLALYTQIEVE